MKFERDIHENRGDADIRAELNRGVAGLRLTKSPQLAQFLRFVVGDTLAGRGNRIKAYTIATDALGREARFDPQADPIVRVEPGRLRRALEHNHETEGRGDPIIIEMPRGSYVPVFRPNIAPHGVLARMRSRPRQFFGVLRDNRGLVALIATVATIVSVSLRMMWVTRDKTMGPEAGIAQQAIHPTKSANGPTSDHTR